MITVLSVVNHLALLFCIPGEETLFAGWTGMNVIAALMLYKAYRNGEHWSWWGMWVMIAAYASLVLFDAQVGLYYLVAAFLMAAAQLLTWSEIKN